MWGPEGYTQEPVFLSAMGTGDGTQFIRLGGKQLLSPHFNLKSFSPQRDFPGDRLSVTLGIISPP